MHPLLYTNSFFSHEYLDLDGLLSFFNKNVVEKAYFEVGDIILPTISPIIIEFRSFSELLKILNHLTLMNLPSLLI